MNAVSSEMASQIGAPVASHTSHDAIAAAQAPHRPGEADARVDERIGDPLLQHHQGADDQE
jgi:hypothetical protein